MGDQIRSNRFKNLIYTALLLGGLLVIPTVLATMTMGNAGLITLAAMVAIAFFPRLSARTVLRLAGAREVTGWEAPRLHEIISDLSNRAELSTQPRLFLIESPQVNAFTTGSRKNPCITVSRGLLNQLDANEITAVLAHEIGHVANNDLLLLSLSDAARRMTSVLTSVTFFLLLVYMPFLLFGGFGLPLLPIFLVMVAPTVSSLILLALCRTREFSADLEAARLMDSPYPLVDALEKIEYCQTSWLERIFNFRLSNAVPELLKTHPNTVERVTRLKELEPVRLRPKVTVEPRTTVPQQPDDFLKVLVRILNQSNINRPHGPRIRVI